jgi:sugar lactone lactonase YvrE
MKLDLGGGGLRRPFRNSEKTYKLFLACILLWLLAPFASRAQNTISTVAGGGSPLNGTSPLAASLGVPTSVTEDVNGNIYVSSSGGGYVFEITAGAIKVFAGTGFSGIAGNGIPATAAPMAAPTGVVPDGLGNLLIADIASSHVFQVNINSGVLTNFAGNATTANPLGGYSGDGGPATQASLSVPQGLAMFGGTIYIADAGNNVIRAVTGGTITTYAGVAAAPCGLPTAPCGDGGPATAASLNNPSGVAVDSVGNLYIADTGDNRVRMVNVDTLQISTVAGTGNPCLAPPTGCGDGGLPTSALLNQPLGVFTVPNNPFAPSIYIADKLDQEVRLVTNNDGGSTIGTVAGDGIMGVEGDGGFAGSAEISDPAGVYVDGTGAIFVADQGNNRIREVSPTNFDISTIAGGGNGGDGNPPLQAVFAQTFDLALDSSNNQYIIDTGTSRIREVTGGIVTTVAGSGRAAFSGDDGPATAATLSYPRGVTIAPAGMFIADTENQRVRLVTNGVISTFAGTGTQCNLSTAPCGDGGPATAAQLSLPAGVAVDAAGNVYVADSGDNRIRKIDNTLTITTVAGTGTFCPVSTSACGDGGPAAQANLAFPLGVSVDSAGDLFIADTLDNRIRKVDATTQTISTVAFSGNPTFSGDGGPATLAGMSEPNKVVVDTAGNLFIGGGLDEVVQRVDAATQTIATVAGNAQQPLVYGYTGDGGPATSALLGNIGLAISATEKLYIADFGNNRIRAVQLSAASTPVPANLDFGNQMVGTPSSPLPVVLTNTGSNDLLITSIKDANEFSQTNNCPVTPKPLAPGQFCTINVTFTPTTGGAANDTLIITDNAPGSPQSIPLTAVGAAPFNLTTTCTSLSVVPGQSAIYHVSLAPAKGFAQSVGLSCSGAPALATCTVNPAMITLDGSTTVQAQVTATTTPATSGFLKRPASRSDDNRLAGLIGLAGMAGLVGLVVLPGKRRLKQAGRVWGLIFCLSMLAGVATTSSCGGGGGGADPPGTAAGTYPLTVTATFQPASGTPITEKVSFDLVVQ